MTFRPILLALCSIHRLLPLLNNSIATCLSSGDMGSERGDLQSLVFIALFSSVETPSNRESEELTFLKCINCGICISPVGAGKICALTQNRDVEGSVSFEALSGDAGEHTRPRETR